MVSTDRHFTVYTDQIPLKGVLKAKDSSFRIIRLRLKISEFDFTIEYKTGKINTNADAFSRIPLGNDMSNSNDLFKSNKSKIQVQADVHLSLDSEIEDELKCCAITRPKARQLALRDRREEIAKTTEPKLNKGKR